MQYTVYRCYLAVQSYRMLQTVCSLPSRLLPVEAPNLPKVCPCLDTRVIIWLFVCLCAPIPHALARDAMITLSLCPSAACGGRSCVLSLFIREAPATVCPSALLVHCCRMLLVPL